MGSVSVGLGISFIEFRIGFIWESQIGRLGVISPPSPIIKSISSKGGKLVILELCNCGYYRGQKYFHKCATLWCHNKGRKIALNVCADFLVWKKTSVNLVFKHLVLCSVRVACCMGMGTYRKGDEYDGLHIYLLLLFPPPSPPPLPRRPPRMYTYIVM